MKLYRVNYSYEVKGFQKRFLSKKMKSVSAEVVGRTIYIKCDELNIKDAVIKIIEDQIQECKDEITSYGRIYLYDWKLEFVPEIKFNQIECYSNVKMDYDEATIEEYIERLSPTEYNEMYGNILEVSKVND